MNASYLRYAGRRLVQAVVVVLLAYVFTFVVISVLPGDPVTNTLRNPENGFTEEEIARIVSYYGLDQPVAVQLWQSLSHFVVGDLGVSLRSNLPVTRLVAEVVPSTLALAASALAVALVLRVRYRLRHPEPAADSTGRACCGRSRRCSCRCPPSWSACCSSRSSRSSSGSSA